jgi:hypothetical protein
MRMTSWCNSTFNAEQQVGILYAIYDPTDITSPRYEQWQGMDQFLFDLNTCGYRYTYNIHSYGRGRRRYENTRGRRRGGVRKIEKKVESVLRFFENILEI